MESDRPKGIDPTTGKPWAPETIKAVVELIENGPLLARMLRESPELVEAFTTGWLKARAAVAKKEDLQ